MRTILLTGAGFSRNWGGWLASEAFEYLIGRPDIDVQIRQRLWLSKKNGGGFEDALAELQAATDAESVRQARALETALAGMFNEMNQALARRGFEPQNDQSYMVRTFLARFDAIFTLNQDLLMEHHYLNDNVMLSSPRRWNGWDIPGTSPMNPGHGDPTPVPARMRAIATGGFQVGAGLQPYFKLHGSSNWSGGANGRLLILGGNKEVTIRQYPLLSWYQQQFIECLQGPGARLMVIGYSFTDSHINNAIMEAADRGGLRMFIIDPLGVDVLDKRNPRAAIRVPSDLMTRLNPRIVGASRRSLFEIFGSDMVEHGKVMHFFT